MGGESSKAIENPQGGGSLEKSELFDVEVDDCQLPIVYSDEYNITFWGLQKLHPFDSEKWGRIVQYLQDAGMVKEKDLVKPKEATQTDLLLVHTRRYLDSLKSSLTVAGVTEVPIVALVPNSMVQRYLLRRLRLQTGGTILGAKLAVQFGWSINIGGGFHHCSSSDGGGFCAYADITLAIKHLMANLSHIKNAMIVDLDAHQGNGHERDFMDENNVYILDAFNHSIYPGDMVARRRINKSVRVNSYNDDSVYLTKIKQSLEDAFEEFNPDFLLYNAGTDIMEGDPLGQLRISSHGIIARDELVFETARKRKIPILMVTSGGYQRVTARVIADSILNLHSKGLLRVDVNRDRTD